MLIMAFFATFPVFSQISDDFSDGDFTTNPVWWGDAGKFVVDEQFRLQLSAPKETSTAQLFTSSSSALSTVWEFDVIMNTKPTTGNYVKVYLCADTVGIGKLWGLCLRIGYNKDIALWYEPQTGTGKSLLKGITGRLDIDTVSIHVKATLDANRLFCMETRLSGEPDYIKEGDVSLQAANIPESKYFGLTCVYSSTKNKGIYMFDRFSVYPLSEEPITPPGEEEPGQSIDSLDIIINEILYQPFSGGDEYVELFNRSDKIIDLSLLSIATRKSDGTLQRIKPLSSTPKLLFPGGYLLVTGLKENVCAFYTCYPDIDCAELTTMVSLPDAGGTIVIFNNKNQQMIDEFSYTNKMHVSGLSNPKGVALERIDPEEPTNDASNWISASTDAGYGTPGYQNSHHGDNKDNGGTDTGLTIIEPNIQGGIDYFQIMYQFSHSDNRCNLIIFDISGRQVDSILNNAILGTSGVIGWNPQDRLKPGIYIVYAEVITLNGSVEKYKLPLVLKK